MANTLAVNPALNAAVDQFILDAERAHDVINGDANKEVLTEDGSLIPSVRKALIDNLYYKTPPLPWTPGQLVRVFNQLYSFTDGANTSWWYAPGATNSSAVQMGTTPVTDPRWRLVIDTASLSTIYAPINSPLFTGNPRGPTPAVGDNSTSLSTTAFVSAAIAAALAADPEGDNRFYDITVTNHADLNKIDVSGQANFKGQIDATTSQMLLNTLRLMANDGKIDFDYVDPAYANKLRTILRPHTITTSLLTVDDIKAATVEIGSSTAPSATANVLIVHGNTDMDYLHLTGNTARPVSDPQLIVDGKAQIKDLAITGTISGVSFGVDGEDISPATVTTDEINARLVNVSEKLTVTGDTEVKNLKINGTVTGWDPVVNVDGLDIKPKTVTTTGAIGVATDLTVNGATNVNNLNITGTVTGLTLPAANVDGEIINPASVLVDGVMTASAAILDDDGVTVTTPAVLQFAMPAAMTGIVNTGDIKTDTLTATSGSIPSLTTKLILMSTISANITTATYKPVITANVQNLTLGANTVIQTMDIPAGAASFMMYFQQDATGSRTVTFDSGFVLLNSGVVNPAPNSISLVQVIYRGTGNLFDVLISPRP